jgi:hypothetical protein
VLENTVRYAVVSVRPYALLAVHSTVLFAILSEEVLTSKTSNRDAFR